MVLTLGTHHVIAGQGSFAITRARGLAVTMTAIDTHLGHDSGSPPEYRGLGHLNLGHAFGYGPRISLHRVNQLVYPIDPEFTLLGYTLSPGCTATVDEIPEVAVANSALQPWDRNAAFWSQIANLSVIGPQAQSTAWTYTVPSGKILRVAHFEGGMVRASPATTPQVTNLQGYVGSAQILLAQDAGNVVGNVQRDVIDGEFFLFAGQTISATSSTGDTGGGLHYATLSAHGTLFDA